VVVAAVIGLPSTTILLSFTDIVKGQVDRIVQAGVFCLAGTAAEHEQAPAVLSTKTSRQGLGEA
jgi:hypothetical protein